MAPTLLNVLNVCGSELDLLSLNFFFSNTAVLSVIIEMFKHICPVVSAGEGSPEHCCSINDNIVAIV